jgi:hypothetical protein
MQQFGRNRPTALSDLAYARFTSAQKRPLGEEGGRLQCSHPLPIHDAKRDCRTHKRSSMCHRSLISANSVRYRRREKLRLGRTFWARWRVGGRDVRLYDVIADVLAEAPPGEKLAPVIVRLIDAVNRAFEAPVRIYLWRPESPTETRLPGWACEIRTQKRRRKLSV